MKHGILLTISLLIFTATATGQNRYEFSAEDMFIFFNPQDNLIQQDQQTLMDPTSSDELLKRARLRLYYGMDTEAMQDIEKVKTINPYALYLHGFYGSDGYIKLIDKEPSTEIVELTLQQRMENYDEYIRDEMNARILDESKGLKLREAIDLITSNQLDAAEEVLEGYAEEYPESAVVYDLLSVVYTEKGLYDDAAEALSDAIAFDPNYAMAWYNFGRIERINGKYQNAKEYFDEAISLRAGLSKAYFERALVNKQMSNFEDAKDDYSFVIEQGGDLENAAVINRGLARKMSGDFEGALNDLNVAIEENPDDACLYQDRGNLQLLLGQLDLARENYDEALIRDADLAEVYYNRGLTLYILNDKLKACRDLQEAIRRGYKQAEEKYELFCLDE